MFREGEHSWGVYILCEGKVKLQTANEGDKPRILRIAQAGDVLGLQSTITKEPYELTAESATPVKLGFVGRKDFGRFLRSHGEACLAAARQLNRNGYASPHIVPSPSLSHAIIERFAKLLLRWSADQPETHDLAKVGMAFNDEELTQWMGCSNATISELLGFFQSSKILDLNHSSLRILNRVELERLIGT